MTSPSPPVLLHGATSADTNTMSSGLVVEGGGLRAGGWQGDGQDAGSGVSKGGDDSERKQGKQ
jgi:hypothetical protein